MKTWIAKPEEIEKKWWIVDAEGKTLGRLATKIAETLRGKKSPKFTPNVDTGDFVVVVNAEKVKLSGNKLIEKKYYRHSRYFGSMKEFTAEQMLKKEPEHIIHEAVRGMLPTNILSRHLMKKLKTYKGGEHPHAAQKPESLKV